MYIFVLAQCKSRFYLFLCRFYPEICSLFTLQLLIQQQTMAQREQNKEAPVRPEQLRPEQALLNVEPAQTTPRGELKQTEERVLSSGTVPAKFPTTSANNSSMLKTTSPRLQVILNMAQAVVCKL